MEESIKNNNESLSFKQTTTKSVKIKNKISELEQSSFDDFAKLASKLKENLNLNATLYEKINKIYDLYNKDNNQNILETLFKNYETIKPHLTELENVIKTSIEIIDKLVKHLDSFNIPLNKFNQNLSNLKLLLSNINLISTHNNRKSMHGFDIDESRVIEKIINNVKGACPLVEENIFVLKEHLKSLQAELINLKDNMFSNLKNEIKLAQDDISLLINQTNKIINEKCTIKDKIDNCNNNYLINNIQHQHNIPHRINQFYITYNNIDKTTTKLGFYNNCNGISNNIMDQEHINKITNDQEHELLQINEDYQAYVDRINSGMINNKNKVYDLSSQTKALTSKLYTDNDTDNIKASLTKMSQVLTGYHKFSNEINLVYKVIKNINEKFLDVEMMEKAIEQKIINKIHSEGFLKWPNEKIAQQAQETYKLYTNNHFEKNKLRQLFDKSFEYLNEIIKTNAVFSFKNNVLTNLESMLNNTKNQLENLNFNIETTEDLKSEITNINQKMAENADYNIERKENNKKLVFPKIKFAKQEEKIYESAKK